MPSPRSFTVTLTALALTVPVVASTNSKAMYQALTADYPLTQVGQVMFDTDYTRITKPGAILAVRLPGIYADVANTKDSIVNTNYADGQITQATGFAAAFGGNTGHSRTLNPNEKVYATQILVKKNAVLLELLTVDVATLGDGRSTRYRAELNVKLPELDMMAPEDVKKTIDTMIADPAVASAVESKTVKTLIGYARCSTDKQDLTAQRQALTDLGVAADRIYVDHGLTGTNRARPGLNEALAAVRKGDTLIVPKLDRLARSVPDARSITD